MKRAVFAVVLVVLALGNPAFARAENLRQEDIMLQTTPEPATGVEKKPIYKGMTSVAVTKFGAGKTFEILAGTLVGFKLEDIIMPFFGGKEKKISTPNMVPQATFHEVIAPYSLPQEVQEKIIHYSEVNENKSRGRFCAVQVNKSSQAPGGKLREDIESTGNQESSNIEGSQKLFEYARWVNASMGRQFIVPDTAGKYNMNLASIIFGGNSVLGFCDWNYESEEKPPVENTVTKLSTFGAGGNGVTFTVAQTIIDHIEQVVNKFGELVEKIFYAKDNASFETRLTEVTNDSNLQELANIGDLTEKEVEKSPYEWTKMLATTRGWTFAFLPEEWAEKEHEHAGGTTYSYGVFGRESDGGGNVFEGRDGELKHPWLGFNNTTLRINDTLCEAAPYERQGDLAYGVAGDKENIVPVSCDEPVPACGTGPPELPGSSSCRQCSPDMEGWAEGDSVPGNKLPPKLIKLVETVGAKVGVPPASILAAMYHEGAFVASQLDPGSYQSGPFVGADQWTDANVDKWSTCGQTMPNCPAEPNAFKNCHVGNESSPECLKAIVGTGQIPKWFWGNGGDSDPWKAATLVDPTRTRETVNPCNLLDSVAATAQELKAYGSVSRTPSSCFCKDGSSNYGSCTKFSMTSTSGASCSPSTWPDDKIVQSHTGLWVGNLPFCPDGSMPPTSEFGNNSPDPAYGQKVLGQYKHFSCQD